MDLPNDIKQLIFIHCGWKQYYELCKEHALGIRLKLLDDLQTIDCDWKQYYELCKEHALEIRLNLINDLPTIEKICEEKMEYLCIVRYLHENGEPIAYNAVSWACENGHFNIVKYFHIHLLQLLVLSLYYLPNYHRVYYHRQL